MSAPKAPEDHSLEIAQMTAQREDAARAQAAKEAAQQRQHLAQLRNNAVVSGRANAKNYFSQQGLVPDQYTSAIDDAINNALAGVPTDDPNPGTYFKDIGEKVYGTETTNARNKALRDVNQRFQPDFENSRINDNVDDATLSAIEQEQEGGANEYIQRLLDRGVITDTGYQAAQRDIGRQANSAKARLNEIGTGEVAGGRQKLRDIANRGRQTSQNLSLGDPFDVGTYSSEVDNAFNDFLNSLGTDLRAKAPTDLFSTGGLAAIAGAGQGAQNTKFNPKALAGIPGVDDENQDEENRLQSENVF